MRDAFVAIIRSCFNKIHDIGACCTNLFKVTCFPAEFEITSVFVIWAVAAEITHV